MASLAAARRLAAELDDAELALIKAACGSDATWSQIASAMGAHNRQIAQKRHVGLSRRQRPPEVDALRPSTPVPAGPVCRKTAPGRRATPLYLQRPSRPLGNPTWSGPGAPRPRTGTGMGNHRPCRQQRDHAAARGHPGRYAGRGVPGTSRWTARRRGGVDAGTYPSRAKALAVGFERSRGGGLASHLPLPGWQAWCLAQILADKDERNRQVIVPDVTRAGTVRPSYAVARTWTAFTGDPAASFYDPLPLYSARGDPGASPGGEWRTRDAARAVASAHDSGIEASSSFPGSKR